MKNFPIMLGVTIPPWGGIGVVNKKKVIYSQTPCICNVLALAPSSFLLTISGTTMSLDGSNTLSKEQTFTMSLDRSVTANQIFAFLLSLNNCYIGYIPTLGVGFVPQSFTSYAYANDQPFSTARCVSDVRFGVEAFMFDGNCGISQSVFYTTVESCLVPDGNLLIEPMYIYAVLTTSFNSQPRSLGIYRRLRSDVFLGDYDLWRSLPLTGPYPWDAVDTLSRLSCGLFPTVCLLKDSADHPPFKEIDRSQSDCPLNFPDTTLTDWPATLTLS